MLIQLSRRSLQRFIEHWSFSWRGALVGGRGTSLLENRLGDVSRSPTPSVMSQFPYCGTKRREFVRRCLKLQFKMRLRTSLIRDPKETEVGKFRRSLCLVVFSTGSRCSWVRCLKCLMEFSKQQHDERMETFWFLCDGCSTASGNDW